MAAVAGVSITTPKVLALESPKMLQSAKFSLLNNPWKRCTEFGRGRMYVHPVAAAPEGLSEKVAESVKNAKEACSENPTDGECAAAWDEVEELSAAASHARDKKKESDPLEDYCKDNPETDECRTYDD
ncbi:calvin cycle protein CP12-1, chloroplastic-like [Olea europaea var. sylvestris]|uniref:calvin cycle protein CP12-1, chloroplastic-like n=1 Tax=Olea europaea var. sylvestris TaxID=158386 RepID=UPI000C1CFED2|nr:calvin cycle protein CP12-1, chloroplastic-like [Olea europaea var. sylvestris]